MTKRFLLFEYATYDVFQVDKTIYILYIISSKNENITNIYIYIIYKPIHTIQQNICIDKTCRTAD